jgi:3-dehydroquinate synthase
VPDLLASEPDRIGDLFGDLSESRRRLVVVDENVMRHYGDGIAALLERYGIEHPEPVIVPGGEGAKSRAQVVRIHDAMERWGVPRFGEDVLLFGGGVLHDLGGFAASQYRRGVPYRMYATTVVNAVDAGFALKVAVNDYYKNRLGAFFPAQAVFADLAFFATLDREQVLDGTGEIVKWAIVAPDPGVFELIERNIETAVTTGYTPDRAAGRTVIEATIAGMMEELAANPDEAITARRSCVGHGMCPAFEPTVTHGKAVVLDIGLSLMIARARGLIDAELCDRFLRFIRSAQLPFWHPVLERDPALIMAALADTARHRHGRESLPVPTAIRDVTYMNEITRAEVDRALQDLHDAAQAA